MIKLINFKDALDDPSNTLSIFAKLNIHLFETPAFPLDWSLATLSVIGDIDEVHHLGGECHPFIMKVYSNANCRSQTLT